MYIHIYIKYIDIHYHYLAQQNTSGALSTTKAGNRYRHVKVFDQRH